MTCESSDDFLKERDVLCFNADPLTLRENVVCGKCRSEGALCSSLVK